MNLRGLVNKPTTLLAVTMVLGEWTGLARAIFRAPAYAALLDLVLVVICLQVVRGAWSRRDSFKLTPIDGLVASFFILALLQTLNPNVPSPLVGLEGFRKTAFTMLAYGVVRGTSETEATTFFRIVAIGSIAAFLLSIRQSVAPLPIELQIIETSGASPISFHSGPVLRAFAPTAGPFHLGILGGAIAAIAVVLARALSPRYLVVAILAAAALGLSLTRANMVGAVVALGMIVLVVSPMPERIRMGVRVAPVLAALGLAVFLTARTVVPTTPPLEPAGAPIPVSPMPVSPIPASPIPVPTAPEGPGLPNPLADRSLQFRFQFWASHLQSISERPLIGYGTSSAGDGFDRLYRDTGSENFDPHSLYLKAALELGVVGLAILVAILVSALFECRRAYARSPTIALIGLGLLSMTIVSGLSGPMLDAYPFNLLFWATIGWLVNTGSARSSLAPALPTAS